MKRITKTNQYKEVYKYRNIYKSVSFLVYYSFSNEFMFGVVASKRVGNSVIRHKRVRQIKEILKKVPEFLMENVAVVIHIRAAINNKSFDEIRKELENTLFMIEKKVSK